MFRLVYHNFCVNKMLNWCWLVHVHSELTVSIDNKIYFYHQKWSSFCASFRKAVNGQNFDYLE